MGASDKILSKLSNELTLQIFGYLDPLDLKAIRLTGDRHLGPLASSLLFTTAYAAARRGVLDTFTSLTTHPDHRVLIKTVVIDSSYVNYQQLAGRLLSDASDVTIDFIEEQENIQRNELSTRLEDAFQYLKNLRRVSYANLSRVAYLPGDPNEDLQGRDYEDGPLFNRRKSVSMRGYDAIGECCLDQCYNGGCQKHGEIFVRQFQGFPLLLRALSRQSSNKLLDLSLGNCQHSNGSYEANGIPDVFFSPALRGEFLHDVTSVFRRLRKLDLTISIHATSPSKLDSDVRFLRRTESDWHPRDWHMIMGLARLLAFAESLEELKIVGGWGIGYLCLSDALGTITWRRLRKLELRRFEAVEDEFEDLLSRHANSLRYVLVDHFNLVDRCWRPLKGHIHIRFPELELMMGCVFHNGQPSINNDFVPIDDSPTAGDREDTTEADTEVDRCEYEFESEGDGWTILGDDRELVLKELADMDGTYQTESEDSGEDSSDSSDDD